MKRCVLLFLILECFCGSLYSQSATFSKNYKIKSNDASKYIGEWHEITGTIYEFRKIEIKAFKTKPDSSLVLVYISSQKKNTNLIVLIKVDIRADKSFLTLVQKLKAEIGSFKKDSMGYVAEGKLFLYKFKPAIYMEPNDLFVIEERVD